MKYETMKSVVNESFVKDNDPYLWVFIRKHVQEKCTKKDYLNVRYKLVHQNETHPNLVMTMLDKPTNESGEDLSVTYQFHKYTYSWLSVVRIKDNGEQYKLNDLNKSITESYAAEFFSGQLYVDMEKSFRFPITYVLNEQDTDRYWVSPVHDINGARPITPRHTIDRDEEKYATQQDNRLRKKMYDDVLKDRIDWPWLYQFRRHCIISEFAGVENSWRGDNRLRSEDIMRINRYLKLGIPHKSKIDEKRFALKRALFYHSWSNKEYQELTNITNWKQRVKIPEAFKPTGTSLFR